MQLRSKMKGFSDSDITSLLQRAILSDATNFTETKVSGNGSVTTWSSSPRPSYAPHPSELIQTAPSLFPM